MTVAIAKWTLDEYHRMVETGLLDNRRVELIRGEIIEMAPEGTPHANASTSSGEYLTVLLIKHAQIRPAKPITLPNGSEPEPDVAIVRRLGSGYDTHHPYPEDVFWLIEYSDSTLQKDLNIKTQVYAEVNIPEYWVVDIKKRQLIVFRDPKDGEYTTRSSYTEGQIMSLAFPDIPISVSSIIYGS